jgi:hypothetical protein
MCFYDQYRMGCDCYKWGNFRQHCSKEYRTGETCGMRLVMGTYDNPEKCRLCTKIDTKNRSIRKEEEKIKRWRHESGRSASIEKAEDTVYGLKQEIYRLEVERYNKSQQMGTRS